MLVTKQTELEFGI